MESQRHSNRESGITLIETLIATVVLTICSLGAIGLIGSSIASNTRNKFDSTTTMLAQSIVEQIAATAVGSGIASLTDCAGTAWTIDTQAGGAAVVNGRIDFTEASPPTNYRMQYVVKSPCTTTGIEQAVYDVRWNVELIGASAGTPTNTYLLTVGAQMLNRGQGNKFFAAPVTLRVMLGN
jgi:type II secretory pathway pseudopilin PulG